jgi:hypothetical protein
MHRNALRGVHTVSSDLRLSIEPFPRGNSYPQMESINEVDVAERSFVSAKIAANERQPNALSDAVFYRRHPELRGRRIGREETALGKEWLAILHDVVEPLLAARSKGGGSLPGATANQDPAVRLAQNIGASIVPDMPGVTVEQLVEKYRKAITPEIPWPVLLAFIRFESGGNFKDATHGSAKNNFTSPPYYELGLFQTPAGLYGTCKAGNSKTSATGIPVVPCTIQPPGREVPNDPSPWARLCRKIGADPSQWTNPVTQVQVGLLNLKTSADVIRAQFKDLFPTPGSDWDLRAAVLLAFARGGGFSKAFLAKYRADLAKLPEDRRWEFLRGKYVGKWKFDPFNVDEKMLLAAKLGYRP